MLSFLFGDIIIKIRKQASKINSAGDKCYRNTTNNIILKKSNWKWGKKMLILARWLHKEVVFNK